MSSSSSQDVVQNAPDDKAIKIHHWGLFLGVALLSLLTIGGIWYLRLVTFATVLQKYSKPQQSYTDAFNTARSAFESANGYLPLGTSFVSIILMWWLWYDLSIYLCDTKRKGHSNDDSGRGRARAAMHEPPGDIFTLAGIGFTFVGLAVGLVNLPLDMIYAAISPPSPPIDPANPAIAVVAVALVFSSSLGIGLVASVDGILLAVLARRLAAQYSMAVKSSAEISRDFQKLNNLDELKRMSDMQTNIKSISDVLSRPSAPVGLPKSAIATNSVAKLEAELQDFIEAQTEGGAAKKLPANTVDQTIRDAVRAVMAPFLRQLNKKLLNNLHWPRNHEPKPDGGNPRKSKKVKAGHDAGMGDDPSRQADKPANGKASDSKTSTSVTNIAKPDTRTKDDVAQEAADDPPPEVGATPTPPS